MVASLLGREVKMNPLLLAIIMTIGACIIQDGVASILYYPKEGNRNHFARWVRIAGGLVLIGIALWGLL